MVLKDYDQLLNDYRMLWNNRLLSNENEDSESILLEAINRDINDENSHPRIRKNKYEKFYMATKRILDSKLDQESKIGLLRIHLKCMD